LLPLLPPLPPPSLLPLLRLMPLLPLLEVRHFADVQQPVRLRTHVEECAEGSDAPD